MNIAKGLNNECKICRVTCLNLVPRLPEGQVRHLPQVSGGLEVAKDTALNAVVLGPASIATRLAAILNLNRANQYYSSQKWSEVTHKKISLLLS
jgi:hypothetical protein